MTLFYAPFYPNGFFFSAITLVVVYWMDKFCLFVSTFVPIVGPLTIRTHRLHSCITADLGQVPRTWTGDY